MTKRILISENMPGLDFDADAFRCPAGIIVYDSATNSLYFSTSSTQPLSVIGGGGGTMTGSAIVDALDTQLESDSWRSDPSYNVISQAIDANLGNTDWRVKTGATADYWHGLSDAIGIGNLSGYWPLDDNNNTIAIRSKALVASPLESQNHGYVEDSESVGFRAASPINDGLAGMRLDGGSIKIPYYTGVWGGGKGVENTFAFTTAMFNDNDYVDLYVRGPTQDFIHIGLVTGDGQESIVSVYNDDGSERQRGVITGNLASGSRVFVSLRIDWTGQLQFAINDTSIVVAANDLVNDGTPQTDPGMGRDHGISIGEPGWAPVDANPGSINTSAVSGSQLQIDVSEVQFTLTITVANGANSTFDITSDAYGFSFPGQTGSFQFTTEWGDVTDFYTLDDAPYSVGDTFVMDVICSRGYVIEFSGGVDSPTVAHLTHFRGYIYDWQLSMLYASTGLGTRALAQPVGFTGDKTVGSETWTFVDGRLINVNTVG